VAEPLSPRAQKVLDAMGRSYDHEETRRALAAAVIRALVEECAYTTRYHSENSELNEMVIDEADALAIAAELEGQP
jgi:hypothetical protein